MMMMLVFRCCLTTHALLGRKRFPLSLFFSSGVSTVSTALTNQVRLNFDGSVPSVRNSTVQKKTIDSRWRMVGRKKNINRVNE